MAEVIVRFTDQTELVINGAFLQPQTALSNMGIVQDGDPRYQAFIAPTPAQQLDAKISAGCQVVSTATPALDGTYPIDSASRANIAAEAQFISTFGEFTTEDATLVWFDQAGDPHSFSATSDFLNFAKALAIYFTALNMAATTEVGPIIWPAQPVTIP